METAPLPAGRAPLARLGPQAAQISLGAESSGEESVVLIGLT